MATVSTIAAGASITGQLKPPRNVVGIDGGKLTVNGPPAAPAPPPAS